MKAVLDAWMTAEHGRFAVWLPVFMATGAVGYFSLTREPNRWGAAAVLVAALLLGLTLRERVVARAVAAVVAATALGFLSGQLATWRAPPLLAVPRKSVVATAVVRAVEPLEQARRVTLERADLGDGKPLSRLVRIRLRNEDDAAIATGDTLRIRALLEPPSPPAYPGGWDLQRDAFYAGLGAYGFALGRAQVVASAPPSGFRRWLESLRETVATRVQAVLSGAEAGVTTALLTGQTGSIPAADRAAFRDSGLAHLLAIAGLHIGIVMALFFGLTRRLLALCEWPTLHWPCKQIAALAALAAGGGYMLLTGAHVPIIRSFAMACLFTLAVLVGRRALSLRGWALAMAVLVLLSPNAVMGVSFQMSFAAVLALISGYAALRPWLAQVRGTRSRGRRVIRFIIGLALTSALAGTASAPYGAYHFGRIQLYYILANMAAVPLTAAWVMPTALLALALMPLGLAAPALKLTGWGVEAVLRVARGVSSLPAATLPVPQAPPWGLAALSLGILWLGIWRSRLRLLGVPLILLGLLSPAFERAPDILVAADGRLAAFRAGEAMFLQRQKGASGFTRDAWQQMWASTAPEELPDQGEAAGGAISCSEAACWLRSRPGGPAALLLRGDAPEDACNAAVLVSLEPIRFRCKGVRWVDRFDVWRNGAYAIWLLPDGVRVLADRWVRGARPWVPPPPVPRPRAAAPPPAVSSGATAPPADPAPSPDPRE
jgi:competence protein ComEC